MVFLILGQPWLLKHVRALPSSCHVYWYGVNQHVRDRMRSMLYDLVSALQVWEPWPMVWIYDMALQAANKKGNYWKIRKVLTTRYRNFHLPSCVGILGIRFPYHGIIMYYIWSSLERIVLYFYIQCHVHLESKRRHHVSHWPGQMSALHRPLGACYFDWNLLRDATGWL
jgi:hypothetical protein